MINWTLINIIGYIVIILLSIIGACIVATMSAHCRHHDHGQTT